MKKDIIRDIRGFVNICGYIKIEKTISSYEGGVVLWDYEINTSSTSGCIKLTRKDTNELLIAICFKANVFGDGWTYRLIGGKNRTTPCILSDGMPERMMEKESTKPEVDLFYSIISEYC